MPLLFAEQIGSREGREFKGQYVVGTHVLSEAEVVALAEEKGLRTYNQ